MNWLAHIFLSEYEIDFQIGNYLADPLKGRIWEGANKQIEKGMQIHKQIDSFTDKHQLFKKSKQTLGEKGLLKAVVVDLSYDYLLTKNWDRYSTIDIDTFLNTFYKQAQTQLKNLPIQAATPLQRLIEFEVLHKYKSLEDLNKTFLRVDKRLSPRLLKRDKVSNYYEKICLHIDQLEEHFLRFFPLLCEEVRNNINSDNLTHWKI